MSEVEFRRATVEDAGELAAVYRSAYSENRQLGGPAKAGSADAGTVEEWIGDARVYLARVGTETVGGVRLEMTDPDGGRVKLGRLGVHDDWKGRGIGSGLLDHAEALVRSWGHATVWLTVPEDLPYLPAFYRERGYVATRPSRPPGVRRGRHGEAGRVGAAATSQTRGSGPRPRSAERPRLPVTSRRRRRSGPRRVPATPRRPPVPTAP